MSCLMPASTPQNASQIGAFLFASHGPDNPWSWRTIPGPLRRRPRVPRGNTWARPGYPLRDQLRFARRFICLFTRSGLCVSNAARNNLVAVLDDFPIPMPFVITGHNAEFNPISHVALG